MENEENYADEGFEPDIYSGDLDELLENDELSISELGFMSGYNGS